MDSKSFERINLCHITPSNGYGQMQKILPSLTTKNTLLPLRELKLFLVGNHRTGLPTSEILGLGHATGSVTECVKGLLISRSRLH